MVTKKREGHQEKKVSFMNGQRSEKKGPHKKRSNPPGGLWSKNREGGSRKDGERGLRDGALTKNLGQNSEDSAK